jgi:hypothetical protein
MRSQGLDLDSLTGATTNDACGYHYLIRKSQTPGNSPTLLDHSISNCETCSKQNTQPDRAAASCAAPPESNVANKSGCNNNIGNTKHGSQAEVLKQRQQQQAVMTASGHEKAEQARKAGSSHNH